MLYEIDLPNRAAQAEQRGRDAAVHVDLERERIICDRLHRGLVRARVEVLVDTGANRLLVAHATTASTMLSLPPA